MLFRFTLQWKKSTKMATQMLTDLQMASVYRFTNLQMPPITQSPIKDGPADGSKPC